MDGDLGQRLAIEHDVGPLHAADQSAVAQPAHAAGGVDAHDPQPAKFAFADPAIAESIAPAADQRHQRLPVQVMPAGAKALRQLAGSFPPSFQGNAAACTYHRSLLVQTSQVLKTSEVL